ncbi:actin-like protein C08B11.6 [Hylaeus volcanicus]|uniref:actin-like protein C08B11.6 n=1 Tax=Hylaeus volcanicus TaxID=313075 RepID=UPI0023B7849E|nr:actin-like protein C08B11.6 [Hylaeus volcanicus]
MISKSLNEEIHQGQSVVSDAVNNDSYSIIILDNGSYSIKAGFVNQIAPTHIFQNCAVQTFGRRDARDHFLQNTTSLGNTVQQGNVNLPTSHARHNNLFLGDDIYTVPEFLCQRPFDHGLLVNGDLEVSIWDKMFSKQYLNISDYSSHGILVTEHFNSPTTCRYTLTEIIFEEFGFDRVVISPGQQLVPFSFNSGLEPIPISLADTQEGFFTIKQKPKRKVGGSGFKNLKSWKIGDVSSETTERPPCQIVVDVGHQTTWIVPLFNEIPLETAVMRIDLGGANVSSLLRQFLSYRQIDLERNELLIHHIKEEGCFVSLNYLEDLRLANRIFSKSLSSNIETVTHLTHQYYLFNLNQKEKSSLKRLFKSVRAARIPHYQLNENDTNSPLFSPVETLATSFSDLLSSNQNDVEPEKEVNHNTSRSESSWYSSDKPPVVYMNIERIKPPELLFYPSDYQLSFPAVRNTSNASIRATLTSKKSTVAAIDPHKLINNTYEPFTPEKQCGIATAIKRAILACPSVTQPYMAQRILLCGGSSCFTNFSRRLYTELRSILPEQWPICIYQQESPSITPWIGGSIWAGIQDSSNYFTFALTRSQYFETG